MANGSISDKKSTSRRHFTKAAGVAGFAASVGPWIITRPARAMVPAGVVSQTLYMQAGSLNFGETPNQ